MHLSDFFVFNSPDWVDSGIAIAACRAGARGCLDLEYASEATARDALARLDRFTVVPYGIKVGSHNASYLPDLLAASPRLAWVVLAGGNPAALIDTVRGPGRTVVVEATSLDEARQAQALGADELILKGQEAAGRVGAETSFILVQRWLAHVHTHPDAALPFHVHGGIGANTAAACALAGARGVVLESQLLLARESPVPADLRQRLTAFDGSETALVGQRLGESYRVYSRPGLSTVAELLAEEERIASADLDAAERLDAWRQTVHRLVRPGVPALRLIGQDASLAAGLAAKGGTVAGILDLIAAQLAAALNSVRRHPPLAEGSALARLHRTRYPIVQGPMTRVSDTAPFAAAVAEAGGLPFLALALLRRAEAQKLLDQTRDLLGDRSWGVGILGFVPAEIRNEQLAAIRATKPPFAIIAGGRPDQARELEKEGIPTYLHVPSPGLLRTFLRDGARKFIFEGRECGGHVGPRTSFVLWESMVAVLLDHMGKGRGEDLAIVFAGGIHDALSAAMVSAIAAPLAERGVAIGALMGTAYLFTREAVEGGAIVPRFQQEALGCTETSLLQTAPGHAIRCVPTPYVQDFERERARLVATGRPHEEVARTLEWMNIGRLRLASKGLDRPADGPPGSAPSLRPEAEQYDRGMYMIGQVASMRHQVVGIADLHDDVSAGSTRLLAEPVGALTPVTPVPAHRPPCDVAIVGLSCFYPGANSVAEFWHNILNKVNSVTEVPASHWDWRLFYDADPRAADKIISRWGGFLKDMPFNPLDYGITPKSMLSIEPLQLYLLEAAKLALIDAGYEWRDDSKGTLPTTSKADGVLRRPFPRERTAAILGIGGCGTPLAVQYGFRTCLPFLGTVPGLHLDTEEIIAKTTAVLPEWTEDSFPGILGNVAVGRIANRFNLGGANYAIDAACGSSLAAVQACVQELELGTSDFAIALGGDTVQTPYAYTAFSKTHALSPKGRCRPFDAAADGIALSEGVAAVILKRLPDAIRDGDRIYAVIKGTGASSDGRDKGLTAPRAEGQLRALRRAYGQAGVAPAKVELIEAHGTGTVVGDQTEARALGQFLADAGAEPRSCAIGSVKSQIGHSKCAAGIAGLIKTALALHTRTLPPTLVETPNPKGNFETGPLYLSTEARPWIHGSEGPRLAGVSAFGFGGTNFHTVLAEYEGDFATAVGGLQRWPAELFVFAARDRAGVLEAADRCLQGLISGARPEMADLAAGTWRAATAALAKSGGRAVLALVADSLEALRERLEAAVKSLREGKDTFADPAGVYFSADAADDEGNPALAFLFPGQGSQYVGMLAETALAFPRVRATIDRAERAIAGKLELPLGRYLYPGTSFQPETATRDRDELKRTEVAQPALAAVDVALFDLLTWLGADPAFLAGHSYGEFVALHAAGSLDEESLFRLSHRRGEVIRQAAGQMSGGMIALDVDETRAAELIAGLPDTNVANANSPLQTVVAGGEEGLNALMTRCEQQGVRAQRLPVACAFHSPLVAAARGPLAEAIAACNLQAPRRTVFANGTAEPHPADGAAVAERMAEHLTSPVRFREQIEAMYAAGARLFVEVGPQAVLTGLVRQTLGDRPYLAVPADVKSRGGLTQLLHLLGQLLVRGVPVRGERLFEARPVAPIDPTALTPKTGAADLPPTTWLVNSVRNKPLDGPEPVLLGQKRTEPPAAKPVATKPVARNRPRSRPRLPLRSPQRPPCVPLVLLPDPRRRALPLL